MATDKTKGIIAIVIGIIVLAVGGFLLAVGIKTQNETAFQFVKRKTKNDGANSVLGGWGYGGYTFYSNNRFLQQSTAQKGTYSKTELVFDDGAKIPMSSVIK